MSDAAGSVPLGARVTAGLLRIFAFIFLLWLMVAGLALAMACFHGATVTGPAAMAVRVWGISLGLLILVSVLFSLVRAPTLLAGSIVEVHRNPEIRRGNWGAELLWELLGFVVAVAASYFTIQFLFVLGITVFSGVLPARMVLLVLDGVCAVAGWVILPRIKSGPGG